MVDVKLMAALVDAAPRTGCLVLVGDADQLPSVGPGAVLADLIRSECVPVVHLKKIFRQAEASGIIQAAHAVLEGETPVSAPADRLGDFYLIEAETPAKVRELLVRLVEERIPKRFGLDPFADIQILTPMNRTDLGVRALNPMLQAVLNPPPLDEPEVIRFDVSYRIGDKVMQTINNYDKEVFNGDVGRVKRIDPEEEVLYVDFDGRSVRYEFDELDELTLAYAMTIHKSQGSEYPAVLLVLHTQHFVMLRRNLLYTALTRGKKLVVIVGNRKALEMAVHERDNRTRFTGLAARGSARLAHRLAAATAHATREQVRRSARTSTLRPLQASRLNAGPATLNTTRARHSGAESVLANSTAPAGLSVRLSGLLESIFADFDTALDIAGNG